MYDILDDEYFVIQCFNRVLGAFDFRKPIVVLRDPETIKQVVVKDFDHFEDHQNFIDEKASQRYFLLVLTSVILKLISDRRFIW